MKFRPERIFYERMLVWSCPRAVKYRKRNMKFARIFIAFRRYAELIYRAVNIRERSISRIDASDRKLLLKFSVLSSPAPPYRLITFNYIISRARLEKIIRTRFL